MSGDLEKKSCQNICVFCAASDSTEPLHKIHADITGELIAKNGFGLVYGGTQSGSMFRVAEAARSNGAKVTGVLLGSFNNTISCLHRPPYGISDEIIFTPNSTERKHKMLKLSNGVIALSGGYGTFDEIATTAELARDKTQFSAAKRFTIVNTLGFYDGLLKLFSQIHEKRLGYRNIYIATDPEQAINYILTLLNR